MSWDEMVPETVPCPCGKGTMTRHMLMNDWGVARYTMEIHCAGCKADRERRDAEEIARKQLKAELHQKALEIATRRYMPQWEALFVGISKKEAWALCVNGNGYPALGTFYKHVKESGLEKYIQHVFFYSFPEALIKMSISDPEIDALLASCERI